MAGRVNKHTKVKDLLALLRHSGWLDQWQLVKVAGLRYGARLYDIRRLGLPVEKKQLGRGRFLYRLGRRTK